MKLYNFLILNEHIQLQTVWEIGKHIETVTENGVIYLLYAIN
jgi:hypothetical protein